jgi:hypothetical protein
LVEPFNTADWPMQAQVYPVNSRALRMDSRGRRCRGGHGVPVFVLINRFGIYQHTVESAERLGNCPQDSSAV